MREILLTSSVLILAVLLLRLAFRDRISRRAQYALWGLVLLRLLVPVSLPGVDFSVLSAAEPVGQAVAERLEQREVYLLPQETVPVTILPTDLPEAVIPSTSYQPEDGWPVVVDSGAGAIVPDAGGDVALFEVFHMFPVLHPSQKSRPLFYGKIPFRSRRGTAVAGLPLLLPI